MISQDAWAHRGNMAGLPVSFLACCTCTCECWPSKARLSGFPFCCFCLLIALQAM